MGCAQSNIENEESVIRCKERKLHMKEAISARNGFAAAHSSYTTALKNLGAALGDYARAEFPFAYAGAVTQLTYEHISLPPPPLPDLPPPPLQRAVTMPELSGPKPEVFRSEPIVEEEEIDEEYVEDRSDSLRRRRSTRRGSAGVVKTGGSSREIDDAADFPIPPPSPPRTPPRTPPLSDREPPSPLRQETDGPWDYLFPPMENVPGTTFDVVDEREEFERKAFEEKSKRNAEAEKIVKQVKKVKEREPELPAQPPPPPSSVKVVKMARNVSASGEGNKSGKSTGESVNLLQVFNELDECCLKASECTHEVSKMLEANRLHYQSNFADERGNIDHSARVMHVITWSKSSQGVSTKDVDDIRSEKHETLATVLEKMLAWEKKLFDEVKVVEQAKLEYDKKVASLNKLQKRDGNTISLERTKAAVSHLHTTYMVAMMSMDSTLSEIDRLRDEQLHSKLVELVDRMAAMWETMRMHHESQSSIGQALKALDISQSSKETSEHHHKLTVQLWAVVQEWYLQFEKLMTQQKKLIKELYSWLKLDLIPMDNNLKEGKASAPQKPPIQHFLLTWQDHLEKLRDEPARAAIQKFAAIINTIMQYQVDEMKLRDNCEDTRREHSRKTQQFEDWFHKNMQRRTPPDELDPDRALDKDHIADRQLAMQRLKKKLEDDMEAHQRQCIEVRQKSCTSLKLNLPELFRSISDFSLASSDMYRNLISISNTQKPH